MSKSIVLLLLLVACLLLAMAATLFMASQAKEEKGSPVQASTPVAPRAQATPSAAPIRETAAAATAQPARPAGVVATKKAYSQALAKDIDYTVYLPGGYEASSAHYPALYLLHGRGDSMASWEPIASLFDDMIRAGTIPPLILILPDAPSSRRASYFIDSLFTGNGSLPAGEKVETAFTEDLIAHVDSAYRTVANRNGRAVVGYSMGGYGALRYALAHPDLFRAAIALSPAVYYPLPPSSSSTREFGAFGKGSALFDEATYIQKDYPALLSSFEAANLPSALFIAVGDDEDANINPLDAVHDLDYEAHTLYNKARRVRNLLVQLRVLDGGHGWDVWRPGLLEGLSYILKFVKAE